MADWQGSTPGDTPGYGNTGQGQAWDANRRDPNPAPWPSQQSQQAQPPAPHASPQPWPQSPPSHQQQQHPYPQASSPQHGVHGAVEQAKDRAVHLAGDAREQVTQRVESGLDRGKARAADTLGGVAQALLQSSQQLRQQQPQIGDYAERAAREMQRFSDYLQRTDVHALVDRAEDVARRQPALFLGGMFALGVVGARFLRSSQRAQRPTYERGSSAFDHADAERYGPDYPPRPSASYPQDHGATPSSGAYGGGAYGGAYGGSAYGGSPYGNASLGATQPVYGGYGSTQPPYTPPLDRDVTDRQRVASEPPYGTVSGGTPELGQESFRTDPRSSDPRSSDPRGGEPL